MITSIDAEKAFDKILHPFMIKNSTKNGHRSNLPQHNKGHIWWTHSKHDSQWWKAESIPPKIRNKTKVSTLTTIIQHNFGCPSYSNQEEKEIKGIQIRKELTLSQFADDMILYIEIPKHIRKLLELISKFSKVAGYKIITQKSLACLYTNSEKSEQLRNQSHSLFQQKESNI